MKATTQRATKNQPNGEKLTQNIDKGFINRQEQELTKKGEACKRYDQIKHFRPKQNNQGYCSQNIFQQDSETEIFRVAIYSYSKNKCKFSGHQELR